MNLLKRWNRRGQIRFSDISDPAFDPRALGRTHAEMMARIYGRLADGTWLTGVEVFRRLYAAVGLRPIVWLTRLPGVSQVLDLGYAIFARHRLRLTGRCKSESCSVKRQSQ
jgi:predicted DCC family thiol-disulfide oxidoreductase YuxK